VHVVAHRPTQTSVTLWVQAEQSESGWTIEVAGPGADVAAISEDSAAAHPLTNVLPGQSPTRVWVHQVSGLQPGNAYQVRVSAPFVVDGTVAATFRTLPDGLPEVSEDGSERPWTLLLASCYSEDSDLALPVGRGPLGEAFRALTGKLRRGYVTTRSAVQRELVGITARGNVSRRYQLLCDQSGEPDLKILTGDQVYLDTPLVLPMGGQSVRRRISRNYSRTWDKLGYFLSHGANICASDDHEWWNDYPNRPPLLTNLPGLRGRDTREEWDTTAREFIRKVQLAEPVVTFDLGGDLSFFVADTRINRDMIDRDAQPPDPADPPNFMEADDFETLIAWIEGLRCPGVLVIGQPLLVRGGNLLDRCMPDFPRQYGKLCRALAVAPYDVAVLSGDVHFGRVARIQIARRDRARPTRLFEVISSPMALVSLFHGRFGLAKGVFAADITMFPSGPDGGTRADGTGGPTTLVGDGRDDVIYAPPVQSTGKRCEDHYMTLEFTKLGGDAGIKVEVRAHLLRIPRGSVPARVQPVSTFVLGGPGDRSATEGGPDYR
jgi:hypothetical protein